MKLKFNVREQIIERVDRYILASDSAKYIAGEITFGDEWGDLPDKWITFKQGTKSIKVILINDAFDESRNVSLSEGTWEVSVHGENTTTGKKLDTINKEVKVLQAGLRTGESALEIPMSEAEQILGIANSAFAKSGEALNVANDQQNKAATEAAKAEAKANAAAESEQNAKAYKEAAETAKTESEQSATNAKKSEIAAGESAAQADLAQHEADLARQKTEAAQIAAETAGGNAQRDLTEVEALKEDIIDYASEAEADAQAASEDRTAVEQIRDNFGTNATQKLNEFNINATNKTNAYNTNASNKLTDYNTNAASKLNQIQSAGAVLYTEQALNDAQKLQSRTNIGAADKADVAFPAANLVTGGDFSKDRAGWTTLFSDVVVENGYAKVVVPSIGGIRQNIPINKKHIHYASVDYYILSGHAFTEYRYDGGSYGIGVNEPIRILNKWVKSSRILTTAELSVVTSTLDLYPKSTTNAEFWVDNVILIDLTERFGAGNEPSQAQMDNILSYYPNSWFDGMDSYALKAN